jgi:ubiquinone/menaquinone biosynthesis C-methylase UbiE
MHKSIEKDFQSNSGLEILEIGANIGEHLNFVSQDFKTYTMTDIRETKFSDLGNPNVKFLVADVEALPFDEGSFDRIISTCVFHHLNDPVKGLEEMKRVVRVGGSITVLLPNDPGVMYRALRGITTLRAAKKQGLFHEVQLVHALEHRNHYLSLMSLINWVFGTDKLMIRFKPFRVKSYNLNAFTVVNIIRVK